MRRFACRSFVAGSTVRVAVTGELDLLTAPRLDRALRRAERRARTIVLDLRELEFIDSSGGHLIVTADRRIRDAGGSLVVVRGSHVVERYFALVGLELEHAAPMEVARLDKDVSRHEERHISAAAR